MEVEVFVEKFCEREKNQRDRENETVTRTKRKQPRDPNKTTKGAPQKQVTKIPTSSEKVRWTWAQFGDTLGGIQG
jgi:hypothetical protein